MILADASGTVSTWSTAGAAVIALAALIVAVLARLDARRSAAASERSAIASEQAVQVAARSAAAEEAALTLARRESEQRDEDRHEQAGPRLIPVSAVLSQHDVRNMHPWIVDVKLYVIGGPERMELRIQLAPNQQYKGLALDASYGLNDVLTLVDIAAGSVVTFSAVPSKGASYLPSVLLRVVATSVDHPWQNWERNVYTELQGQRALIRRNVTN